jgi:hypothetical protein
MRTAIFHSARDSPEAPQRHKSDPPAVLVAICDHLPVPWHSLTTCPHSPLGILDSLLCLPSGPLAALNGGFWSALPAIAE